MRKKLFSILALLLTVCGAWAQSNEDTYIVAGSEPEIFGTSWDGSNQANQMVKGDDGKYSKAYTVDKAYDNVQLKVVKNGEDWFGVNGNNVEFKLTGAGSFTVSFDPARNVISVAGEIVSTVNELEFETVYAVGNGEGNWLNGASWDPAYVENEMTEIADGVWEITFYDVPEGFGREVKFALDGAWTHNFGGRFEDFGAQSDAVYNGDNITFDTDDDCDITIQLDLSEFDFDTKEGAKFKINIVYPTDQTDISGATVTGIESSYDWTGNAIEPVPVVTLDGNVLSSETDYSLTYSDGCTFAGDYSVTITGKGNYAGEIVVPFTINSGYYLLGTMNNWSPSESYRLVENTQTDGEYYINDVQLNKNAEFKVRSASGDWYPSNGGNFTVPATTTYNIYFQPDGSDNRAGWYFGKIYSVVTLNETNNSDLLGELNGTTVNVILNRTLKTGGWNSFCVPFEVDIPTGWTVKELGSAQLEAGALTLGFQTPSETKFAAGKPYLVKVPSQITSQSFTDVIVNTTLAPTNFSNIVSFIPVISPTKLDANDKTVLFIKDGTKLTYPSADGNINGFRAYFKQPTNSAARVFNMSFDDDATGISFVLSDEAKTDNGIYMMDGRRVQGQPKQKGVYIVNGKKTIIK